MEINPAFFHILLLAFTFGWTQVDPLRDLGNFQVFPKNNPWNWDISKYQVHPNSANYIHSIGPDKTIHPDFGTTYLNAPIGIPYQIVQANEVPVQVNYTAYGSESDPGPFPIPLNILIEGGPNSAGDRHAIAVDTTNKQLYELYRAFPKSNYWNAESGAKFNLATNDLRPEGWTSADAAGLPIFPGLLRWEEVYVKKEVNHALRFTVVGSQKKYIWPARHYASNSTDPNKPPMGLRMRLKAAYDISGFSTGIQVILTGLKKHGMFMADNGSDWFISGAHDPRWDDDELRELRRLKGSDFEAIRTVDDNGDPIFPIGTGIKKASQYHLRKLFDIRPLGTGIQIKNLAPSPNGALQISIQNISGQTLKRLLLDSHELPVILEWPQKITGIYWVSLVLNGAFLIKKIVLV